MRCPQFVRTLTTQGRLLPAAYQALADLRQVGLRVIPVTGRPAGWCDLIARTWPVDGVIGENGAFYLWHDPDHQVLRSRHWSQDVDRSQVAQRLAAMRDRILHEV
ncbi:MAG: HAD family hydrolase, partial [Betaproteobacteria bacterium]|nr:HAD family hydrolase [Betaproteobacteria bacterium]